MNKNLPITYAPVGVCIYCGDTVGPLSKEHIIPHGLGNWLILPKASCKSCADITSRIEHKCLRNMIGPIRYRMNMGRKKHKDRPKSIWVPVTKNNGRDEVLAVPVMIYPQNIALMCFSPPGILSGAAPKQPHILGMWGHSETHLPGIREYTHTMGPFNPNVFMRMLAKIGHSLVVSQYGLIGFKPLLTDFIRFENRQTNAIGNITCGGIADPHIHNVLLREDEAHGKKYVSADIRLFAKFGSPIYRVVVGEL